MNSFGDSILNLHSKEHFKENYARAVCCAIPEFDLLIIDEGHNLKAGLHRSAARRNRVLALAFGNDPDERTFSEQRQFPNYGPRAKRFLFLSATPVEDDYRHLYNQLDVFGLGSAAAILGERTAPDEVKRATASTFLIRRVSTLDVNGSELTKNLYRREWRAGGVERHDLPLPVPDERQRLIVALMQKKVSELLANEKFNHSFQIGMLASFESFFQTAKVARTDTDPIGTFDDVEQTDDELEREGIDVDQVNRIAANFKKHFGHPMPHPKMDALVAELQSAFDSGRKALVFVRRVASVKEIKEKLDCEYNSWISARLRQELRSELQPALERVLERYQEERASNRRREERRFEDVSGDDDPFGELPRDEGDVDTFFAWFFRGEGPAGVLSGAAVSQRFSLSRFALSSFFSDNYASALLSVRPGGVFEALVSYTGWTPDRLKSELETRAGAVVRGSKTRRTHLALFDAFQTAAISILAAVPGELRKKAAIIRDEIADAPHKTGAPIPLGQWLETPTFFTSLRDRPQLKEAIWPDEPSSEFIAEFRRREIRRELIASMFRLGNPLIDLYSIVVNHLGRLDSKGSEREDLANEDIAPAVLDMLEVQRNGTAFRAYQELHEAAANFDAILDVNMPNLWSSERRLAEVSRELGITLRAQQPVGGMSGEVSKTLVSQFRMPGYPFVLVTTDLLQEGEDLHLFCSDVYHYGISWMPSSMEQRIGRIDRVRSKTERRLTALDRTPDGNELLQVFYPYLKETVEVFQVNRVLERMDRFIRLMHESLISDEDADRKINIAEEVQRGIQGPPPPPRIPLKSAFPVKAEMIRGPRQPLAVSPDTHDDLLQWFWQIQDELQNRVTWDSRLRNNQRTGKVSIGDRQQGFTIFLQSVEGVACVRCVSPVGAVNIDAEMQKITQASRALRARIAAVHDPRFHHYTLTAEGDVLVGRNGADSARVDSLIRRTTEAADALEDLLLHIDADAADFRGDLEQEPHIER